MPGCIQRAIGLDSTRRYEKEERAQVSFVRGQAKRNPIVVFWIISAACVAFYSAGLTVECVEADVDVVAIVSDVGCSTLRRLLSM